MSKTISTSGDPPDIDGLVVEGNESLKQRIRSAFHFRLGEWFMRTDEGVDYEFIFKHQVSKAQVAQIFVRIIREEGAEDIKSIRDVQYDIDPQTREYIFSCRVDTIYGTLDIKENIR